MQKEDTLPPKPVETPKNAEVRKEDAPPAKPAENPKDSEVQKQDDLSFQPAEAPKDEVDLSKAPADPGAMVQVIPENEIPPDAPDGGQGDTVVTVNGTPGEAFLRKLREGFGLPEDAPVLFGDHDQIGRASCRERV